MFNATNLVRITNQLRVAQRQEHCNELRRQITLVEEDIAQLLQRIKPIDFTQIDQVRYLCFCLLFKPIQWNFVSS